MEQEALLLASAAVVGVACAKLGSAIGDDSAVMVGGRSLRIDLVDMKTTLEAIGAPLEGAQMPTGSTGEEGWLKRVKEAAYDVCDMLDDLQANNTTTPPAANTIRTGMLSRLAIVPKATNKITNRTNTIRDNLRVILQESPSFTSEGLLYRRRETTPPHIVEETMITGRDEDKQRIVLAVLSAADNIGEGKGPIILPIVGLRTIGKTILAKLVYIDTRFKDYSKVWVCASANFDLLKMGKSIISQLSGAASKDSNDMEFIMGRLNELLGGKKVLVVLDGLWEVDESELERLRQMLSPSDKGSKVIVIVTTRSEVAARRICTLPPYMLDPLYKAMLSTSYQDMPPRLRLCFAYCAIFPRGHRIARDELIHQWIALDFIQPSDTEEYITTLLGMSFLEPTKSASVSY